MRINPDDEFRELVFTGSLFLGILLFAVVFHLIGIIR